MVESGGLENRCPFWDRGFESLSLRNSNFTILLSQYWRGARAAESGSLLRSCAHTGTVGSNPTLSEVLRTLHIYLFNRILSLAFVCP